MANTITTKLLIEKGLSPEEAQRWANEIPSLWTNLTPPEAWKRISQEYLQPTHPFPVHQWLFEKTYADWDGSNGPPPAWLPDKETIESTNLHGFMGELGLGSYQELFNWSIQNREEFWSRTVQKLDIFFRKPPEKVLSLEQGIENPQWLEGAEFNLAESCFTAPEGQAAIVYQEEGGATKCVTYDELNRLSNRVANGLHEMGFQPGDAIAIDMPMTMDSVAIYLGIVKYGAVVVSIADSFASAEIQTRLHIAQTKGIFTQDFIYRGKKKHPLYSRVTEANAPVAIVLPGKGEVATDLRAGDTVWEDFLSEKDLYDLHVGKPNDPINILFSSGTTGEPKAIPWTQTTPIKGAMDGYFHHDIQPGDVVAWPTNLGWMMGPWLIFATLVNKGTIALFNGIPSGRAFGEFVQNTQVNMLGLVPSIVKAWQNSGCMQGLDWSAIKVFSSTGECSNSENYLFLMSLAGYRPVIEYCGGTEIGGGFITGTRVQPASPATFSTPTLGVDVVVLDESGKPTALGELFLVPPSMGLSNTLLNRDHHEVYFADTPQGPNGETLRRHGDEFEKLANGYYRGQGRADDTMNLGGIKTSAAEIERVVNQVEPISETAAIAIDPKGGGPSQLVIYSVLKPGEKADKKELGQSMQKAIKTELNPLFKIHDVVVIDKLPRTASNKVMRRVLRSQYT